MDHFTGGTPISFGWGRNLFEGSWLSIRVRDRFQEGGETIIGSFRPLLRAQPVLGGNRQRSWHWGQKGHGQSIATVENTFIAYHMLTEACEIFVMSRKNGITH